jgi:hypothetical protein
MFDDIEATEYELAYGTEAEQFNLWVEHCEDEANAALREVTA